MYRVIRLYGDFEPWWLLEGWQEDIVMCQTFDDYAQAEQCYQTEWHGLAHAFPKIESKSDKMAVFWDPKEQRWCDECDEFLQQYHSLLILDKKEFMALLPEKEAGRDRIKACHLRKAQ